jgi:hypothetical protein
MREGAEQKPRASRSWKGVYLFVIFVLFVVIVFLYLFTQHYK